MSLSLGDADEVAGGAACGILWDRRAAAALALPGQVRYVTRTVTVCYVTGTVPLLSDSESAFKFRARRGTLGGCGRPARAGSATGQADSEVGR